MVLDSFYQNLQKFLTIQRIIEFRDVEYQILNMAGLFCFQKIIIKKIKQITKYYLLFQSFLRLKNRTLLVDYKFNKIEGKQHKVV